MCSGGGGGGSVSIENQSDEDLALYQAPVGQLAGYDEEGNPIYEYGENYGSEVEQYNSAQAEIDRRQQVKDQLAAQAAARENILKTQQEQAAEMEQQQAAIVTQQQEQATQLQAQQTERLTGIRTVGSAVTQSLRILGKQQTKQGPTAAATAPGGRKAVSRMAPSSGLRIGSTQAGSGAGANVAI
jgi:uncharacterized protein (DUF3084 family)